MKKNRNFKLRKAFFALLISLLLAVGTGIGVCAEEIGETPEISEVGGEDATILPDYESDSGETDENIFEEIYAVIEANADKIFSILAFIGTLVVSVGYKSGLIPLLNDALSKLKAVVDDAKANGEKMNADTKETIAEMDLAIKGIEKDVGEINANLGYYEDLRKERNSMRSVIEGQIDMLYAIFMTSSLPQYQKDEIGAKIQSMREELASYEKTVE